MFGLDKLLVNTVKIVAAPIQVAAEVANIVVKPIADVAEEVVKTVKEETKEIK